MKKTFLLIRTSAFWGIFLFLFILFKNILAQPIGTQWAVQTGMEDIHKHRNKYDVCFFGTSMVIANICNQELYEKYGIAGISLGEPDQPLYLLKYTLEEVLKYQRPKVVCLDTRPLFYSTEEMYSQAIEREYYFLHNSLDEIKSADIKYKALMETQEYINKRGNDIKIDLWDYYSVYYYSHENWKNITNKNFESYEKKDCMNGNVALFDMYDNCPNMYDYSDASDIVEIDGEAESCFAEMIEMCRELDIEVIFLTGYVKHTKAEHQVVAELAERFDCAYIDINEDIEKMDFSHLIDVHDLSHFNLSGAIKWTDHIGEYLVQNYDFPDRRENAEYDWYKEQTVIFNWQKDMIDTKQSLLAATTFDDYLIQLKEIDHNANIIFITAFDEVTDSLDENAILLLNELALLNDAEISGSNYVAVIYAGKTKEKFCSDEIAMIEEEIAGIPYEISAGNTDNSIVVNGKECSQRSRGVNVVVYNRKLNKVVSSVFFDTCTTSNPQQGRICTINVSESEVDLNVWERQ